MKAHRLSAFLIVFGCATLAGCVAGAAPPDPPPADSSSSPPAPVGVVTEELAGRPIGVADVQGEAWFALAGAGAIARPGGQTAVGRIPLRLAAGSDGVWVSVFGEGRLALVGFDGALIKTVDLGKNAEPEGLALDGDVLWVVSQTEGAVLALGTGSGEVIARVPVGPGPRLTSVGTTDIWVTTYGNGAVSAVDRATRAARVSRSEVCRGIQGVTEATGVVWVACTLEGVVIGLDRADLTEVARFPLERADAVTTDGTRVIAVGQTGPTALEINPDTRLENERTILSDTDAVGDGNIDATIIGNELIITHPDANKVFRLGLSPALTPK